MEGIQCLHGPCPTWLGSVLPRVPPARQPPAHPPAALLATRGDTGHLLASEAATAAALRGCLMPRSTTGPAAPVAAAPGSVERSFTVQACCCLGFSQRLPAARSAARSSERGSREGVISHSMPHRLSPEKKSVRGTRVSRTRCTKPSGDPGQPSC